MALEQKLNLRLSQRLVMTPSLPQAIKLLQMSQLELEEVLTQEMAEKPVLEEEQEEAAREAESAEEPEAPESSEQGESSEQSKDEPDTPAPTATTAPGEAPP